ncbi:MAG TPA: NAD(P)H-quinone oxidoreductase [Smithellaceae bacterium]|nr:NAD(P)H-quinone oxidoreductase [Smithellaceae bacterium]HRS82567.1 NAD(P)H-quinone oxidoreductase [Smithellaceae bacterium]
MKYIDHGKGGPPACMILKEGPSPQIKAGEVLIEVAYAGVNRPDVFQRMGAYPPPPDASPILGLEVAGRIAAVADDVTEWTLGDSVCALTPGGGYAEYCTVPALHCLPVPRGLSLACAASLPENYFTVWSNVFDAGRLQAGENFLAHGGAGGIGYTAIQLAKAFGASVFTTVTGAEQMEAVKKLGADVVLDYETQDWSKEIENLVGRRGIDCILDFVGGPYIQKNLRLLARNGRLVQIAFLQGAKVELDCLPILTKNLTFTGSMLRPRSLEEKAAIARALLQNVWPLFEAGKLKVLISAVFELAEAAQAHALMESAAHIGKLVLKVR